jgi:hypothetical protein
MPDADRFRKQADECRQQAEKAINPLDQEAWLRIAGEWLKMAAAADQRRGGGPHELFESEQY